MTTYGTIQSSSSSEVAPNLEYLSRAKEKIVEGLGARRPWDVVFSFRSLSIPGNGTETLFRLKTNAAYFAMNYAILILVVLFLTLLWHPFSLLVFLATLLAWSSLYFLRSEPLVILGHPIDDKVVLIILGLLTIFLLLLTSVTLNVVGSVMVGIVFVVLHGVFRKTDYLGGDEESTGLISDVVGHVASPSS